MADSERTDGAQLPYGESGSTVPFTPAWWLPSGHVQTLWRRFAGAPVVTHQRERLELRDGDFIDLDWVRQDADSPGRDEAIVFILHGLCGCSSSPYITSLQAQLQAQGLTSVAMNFRGCSGEVNRLARAYHSGISDDVQEVMSHLVQAHPDCRFTAVGYSLGGNVLLKWLGEQGQQAPVERAVAVSTPFDLAQCSLAMGRGPSRLYGRYFVRRLSSDLRGKRVYLEQHDAREQAGILAGLGDPVGIRSIWEFDDRFTAPLHGFADAADYYARSSSRRFLPEIRKDTLLIQSADDPLIPDGVLPAAGSLPDNVQLLLSRAGGHVGFIAGAGSNWLERRIADFVARDPSPEYS